MNLIEPNVWVEALGWTLVHSLWQGWIVYLLFLTIVHVLRSASPSIKYLVGVGALVSIVLISACTFLYLLQDFVSFESTTPGAMNIRWDALSVNAREVDPSSLLLSADAWINSHMAVFVTLWLAGSLFFGLQLLTSWWYPRQWTKLAEPVTGFWGSRLSELTNDLRIQKIIVLAQSATIDSPVLVGYVKPVILLPVGMLTGLSVEQVEAVLLHELAHIKRHDYVVNFFQSAMEVVLFFNPFVRAISSHLRRTREECCDDIVVTMRNPLAYARALHHLEEVRVSGIPLVLTAAGRKNQLLKRIKRIMETGKKENSRVHVLPALLLIVTLIGAWVSVQANWPQKNIVLKEWPQRTISTLSDTTRKDSVREKSASYSRRTITTLDEKGNPHTEVTEDFKGDEELRPLATSPFELNVDIPFPPMPEFAPFDEVIPDSLSTEGWNVPFADTIPGLGRGKGRNMEDVDMLRSRADVDRAMRILEENLRSVRQRVDQSIGMAMDGRLERELERAEEELRRIAPQQELMAESMRKLPWNMRNREEDWARGMAERGREMRFMDDKRMTFEKELTEELVKDGYLHKDDKIKSIHWEGDAKIEVNGKKIKDQDLPKYFKLHKKYLEHEGGFRHVE